MKTQFELSGTTPAYVDTGKYTIRNQKSGKVLEVQGGEAVAEAHVILADQENPVPKKQQFHFFKASDESKDPAYAGYFIIGSGLSTTYVSSTFCISVPLPLVVLYPPNCPRLNV